MKKVLLTVLLALVTFTAVSADIPKGWTVDINAALKQAKAEKKQVLLLFTGSDWCGWCIRLKKDVFSKNEFKKLAADRFVLVYFDFPHRKKISDEQQKIQLQWQKKIGVSGYPTTVILDSNGKQLHKISGYMPLKDYLKAIYPAYRDKSGKDMKSKSSSQAVTIR